MPKKASESKEIIVQHVDEKSLEVYLIGKTPLIINRMAEKARQELLLPKGRKTAAEKQGRLKHHPYDEFRSSIHSIKDENAPTYLAMPASAPKRALANAAVDLPGTKKAQVGRLTVVEGVYVGVYGLPKLFMSVVRNSDMNKTPDIRTRCIVPEWVMFAKVNYVSPIINPTTILNLFSAAGLYIGIGDWRPEKGAGNFGQFAVAKNMAEVESIMQQGRKQQIEAMEAAIPYDDESAELLAWFDEEVLKRGVAA